MIRSEQRRLLTEYVAGLRSLCAEVSAATSALSRNDVKELEARLEAQQVICQQLQSIAAKASSSLPSPEDGVADIAEVGSASSQQVELRQAQQELAHLNQVFASLLKRTEKTVDLLSLLCQSYAGRYGNASSAPATSHLSCEA